MKGKLDREKLAKVVGGNKQEMDDFRAVIDGNPRLKSIWDKYMAELDSEFEATACTVTEALDLGFSANNGPYPNIYDDEYTHEEVLSFLKNY